MRRSGEQIDAMGWSSGFIFIQWGLVTGWGMRKGENGSWVLKSALPCHHSEEDEGEAPGPEAEQREVGGTGQPGNYPVVQIRGNVGFI